jgi:uncharacterized membrane protein YccC
MIIVDRLLVGGLRFVLDKIGQAVDAELNDAGRLRDELLAAQMRLELGEIDEAEFTRLEADVLARLRALRRREARGARGRERVTGVEIVSDDERER